MRPAYSRFPLFIALALEFITGSYPGAVTACVLASMRSDHLDPLRAVGSVPLNTKLDKRFSRGIPFYSLRMEYSNRNVVVSSEHGDSLIR
jgi:hypothetical protein